MKSKIVATITLSLLIITALSAVGFAAAITQAPTATHVTLVITDTNDNLRTEFAASEQIKLTWTASINPPPTTPTDVIVDIEIRLDDEYETLKWSYYGAPGVGTVTIDPLEPGSYTVKVIGVNGYTGAQKTIGVDGLFVVPESILGTLAVIGAGFAAFGLVKYKKLKLP